MWILKIALLAMGVAITALTSQASDVRSLDAAYAQSADASASAIASTAIELK